MTVRKKRGDMDKMVHGFFYGMAFLCVLMLNFPKHKTCEVDYGDVNHTHVRIGVWND